MHPYPMTREQRSELGKPLWEWQVHDFEFPDMTYQELEQRLQVAINAWVALDASHELADTEIAALRAEVARLRNALLEISQEVLTGSAEDKSQGNFAAAYTRLAQIIEQAAERTRVWYTRPDDAGPGGAAHADTER